MKRAALLVLVACAPKQATPVTTVAYERPAAKAPSEPEATVNRVSVPRPEIDIDLATYFPDTHDELRWPEAVTAY